MAKTIPVPYEWLMPLAPWEPAERLLKALDSLHKQTWPASRLVVSVDGQLSTELTEVLHRAPLPVHILQSASWQGTGATLAAGLSECRCKWVLRADADDRSAPNRAERQLSVLVNRPDIAVLGAQLRERSAQRREDSLRRVPLTTHEIQNLLSWRNPINHPTAALNRQKIIDVGNYRDILAFEDWDLWLRLNKQSEVLVNLPDILVTAEVDKDHLRRRHGSTYAKQEFQFLWCSYQENLIAGWQFAFLMLARLPWRILPTFCLSSIMGVLRTRTKSRSYLRGEN